MAMEKMHNHKHLRPHHLAPNSPVISPPAYVSCLSCPTKPHETPEMDLMVKALHVYVTVLPHAMPCYGDEGEVLSATRTRMGVRTRIHSEDDDEQDHEDDDDAVHNDGDKKTNSVLECNDN